MAYTIPPALLTGQTVNQSYFAAVHEGMTQLAGWAEKSQPAFRKRNVFDAAQPGKVILPVGPGVSYFDLVVGDSSLDNGKILEVSGIGPGISGQILVVNLRIDPDLSGVVLFPNYGVRFNQYDVDAPEGSRIVPCYGDFYIELSNYGNWYAKQALFVYDEQIGNGTEGGWVQLDIMPFLGNNDNISTFAKFNEARVNALYIDNKDAKDIFEPNGKYASENNFWPNANTKTATHYSQSFALKPNRTYLITASASVYGGTANEAADLYIQTAKDDSWNGGSGITSYHQASFPLNSAGQSLLTGAGYVFRTTYDYRFVRARVTTGLATYLKDSASAVTVIELPNAPL